ncbi:glycoside hydrolase family 88 protein [Paenibacillus sp. FSL H8-0537]|uniref:glycoside hydrolase family 88/105 protein n=1 Tax=Paenibacillus sp. FSL H8-0537 TaxID=2921399 RepID=UPI00310106BD
MERICDHSMSIYFQTEESAQHRFGDKDSAILKLLADRYVGANPQAGFIFRAFNKNGVLQNAEGLYELDLALRFPEAKAGQLSYGAGLVWSDEERSLDINVRCLGPVRLYFNGELVFRSNVIEEISPDATVKLSLVFAKGWNSLWLSMTCTPAGFGCQIGSDEAKVRIMNVRAPFEERYGQAGWIFSQPVDAALESGKRVEVAQPDLLGSQRQESGLDWLPVIEWTEEECGLGQLERIFGEQRGKAAYAWTTINQPLPGKQAVVLEGESSGELTLWLGGQQVGESTSAGSFRFELLLDTGKHHFVARSVCGEQSWGFELTAANAKDGSAVNLSLPQQVHGSGAGQWLYVGPFAAEATSPTWEQLIRTDLLYPLNKVSEPAAQRKLLNTYWQLDRPNTWVRPYYENAMLSNKWTVGTVSNYARWDYPLGVTIYGLLQTGRFLERPDIVSYATQHVEACTEMYDYSFWDREQYGFPAINQQLVMMKMLDNCGSFGSAMLESRVGMASAELEPIAERIADFMLNKLERKPDGAFYRTCEGEYAANTMWADDLYMSTPFLCRYARLTGNREALDEAAKQFLRFKSYLFMPEEKLMSHVYDFKYDRATGIPWGRGNGWTIFSLTEVLEALPQAHELRDELLDFFNELCEGYAARQSERGLWHQVVNRPDTYLEASCTAMFAYGFARGVRFGWVKQPAAIMNAAFRAWDGLTRYAIDRQGNVHGVCSGSRYAFTADYYDQDLRTVVNDNHGIGIMMLAGTEVAKLKRHLQTQTNDDNAK